MYILAGHEVHVGKAEMALGCTRVKNIVSCLRPQMYIKLGLELGSCTTHIHRSASLIIVAQPHSPLPNLSAFTALWLSQPWSSAAPRLKGFCRIREWFAHVIDDSVDHAIRSRPAAARSHGLERFDYHLAIGEAHSLILGFLFSQINTLTFIVLMRFVPQSKHKPNT